MSYGYHQLDVTATLTAYLLFGYLYTTTVTNDSFITDTLVLSAMTFIVLCGTKDALAEQTVAFRLVSTVIDGLGFEHLSVRILQDLFWRSQTNGNLSKVIFYLCFFLESHNY